jgi:DNA-directed RNA polymerase specialized sigma24 family protein
MPTVSDDAVHDFDDFYLASRRRLVLSAYALTGDLAAARNAVETAFVAARHHWRKVRRLPDPEEWVRPRAWAMAQRRHVGRRWHREKGISAEQKGVLRALHHLSDQQRKVLLLAHLAALSVSDIGRELGETSARVEDRLGTAIESFCRETGTPSDGVRDAIESLAPIAEAAALPGSAVIHRAGQRRRMLHGVGGTAVLLLVTLLGGLFVVRGGVEEPAAAGAAEAADATHPVTDEMLLSLPEAQRLAPGEPWRLVGTSDNTDGDGINSVCQDARFADPHGKGTLVRSFATMSAPATRRTMVETVEISRSTTASQSAYRTTLGWFAGCTKARLQLLNTYRVRGLGEEAQMLKLRIPNDVRRTYVVGLARTGSLTVSTVSETLGGRPVAVDRAVSALTNAVRNVCASDPSGPCPGAVSAAPVLPPPSGETRGTLAAADLPVIGKINKPWVGTQAVRARPNIAATTCDKANFARAGAPRALTRTFLIPQAKLPKRFGIAETVGPFASERRAHGLVRSISAAMAGCEKKDLGAKVSSEVSQPNGYRGSEYAMWRLDSEINDKSSVGFWMGVARVGRYVSQVNFTPTGDNDVDEDTFQALITRARDRLFELPASSR